MALDLMTGQQVLEQPAPAKPPRKRQQRRRMTASDRSRRDTNKQIVVGAALSHAKGGCGQRIGKFVAQQMRGRFGHKPGAWTYADLAEALGQEGFLTTLHEQVDAFEAGKCRYEPVKAEVDRSVHHRDKPEPDRAAVATARVQANAAELEGMRQFLQTAQYRAVAGALQELGELDAGGKLGDWSIMVGRQRIALSPDALVRIFCGQPVTANQTA